MYNLSILCRRERKQSDQFLEQIYQGMYHIYKLQYEAIRLHNFLFIYVNMIHRQQTCNFNCI